jgi:TetR/AcrR family transcriptional regulator, transcriptional repressor of bet genes
LNFAIADVRHRPGAPLIDPEMNDGGSVPKLGMEPIRRQQLIAATIESIHNDGFANTTIARISRRAGLSSGIVAHYFQDKAGLLEATMRTLAEDLRRQVIDHLARARTPRERVLAVIDANFAPEQSAPEVVTAWLAFWAQVRQSPKLARIQRIYRRRLRSNLLHALRQMLPADRAETVATGLAALIDGLWLNSALVEDAMTADQARAIARDYLAAQTAGQPATRAATQTAA